MKTLYIEPMEPNMIAASIFMSLFVGGNWIILGTGAYETLLISNPDFNKKWKWLYILFWPIGLIFEFFSICWQLLKLI